MALRYIAELSRTSDLFKYLLSTRLSSDTDIIRIGLLLMLTSQECSRAANTERSRFAGVCRGRVFKQPAVYCAYPDNVPELYSLKNVFRMKLCINTKIHS